MQMAVTSIFTKTLASLFPVPRAPDFLASHFDIDTSSSMGTSLNERIGTELGKFQRWLIRGGWGQWFSNFREP